MESIIISTLDKLYLYIGLMYLLILMAGGGIITVFVTRKIDTPSLILIAIILCSSLFIFIMIYYTITLETDHLTDSISNMNCSELQHEYDMLTAGKNPQYDPLKDMIKTMLNDC